MYGRFFLKLFFCVLQQTESHIGLEQYEDEQTMSEFRFLGELNLVGIPACLAQHLMVFSAGLINVKMFNE